MVFLTIIIGIVIECNCFIVYYAMLPIYFTLCLFKRPIYLYMQTYVSMGLDYGLNIVNIAFTYD